MGLLRGRGTLDPRYFRHATPVIEGDMTARIIVLRPHDGTQEPVWNDVTETWEMPENAPVWRGMARIQPNKDWRARNREFALETSAEHAVRVQMNIFKNWLVPKPEWPAPPVDIQHGYIIEIEDNPNDRVLENYLMTVRNPMGASDNWHRTLLCDVNIGGRLGD